jgi:hypothetical protein
MSGNEAAFPQQFADDPTQPVRPDNPLFRGLTKREWFASMALQGLLAEYYEEGLDSTTRAIGPRTNNPAVNFAVASVKIADAILAELAK